MAGRDHRRPRGLGPRPSGAPAAPFAVNQIVHKTNDRLEHDMEVCAKYKVPIVITSLGARADVNDAVHGWGGIVLHDVINNTFAHKAIEKGADGLIAVAAGAGGHAGVKSPFALVQEIRQWFDGPIALSGAIATGARGAGRAGDGRGLRLHRLGLHRDRGGARGRGLQAVIVDSTQRRHRLHQPLHRRARQLPEPSIRNAGMDPDNLPEGDPSKMNFGGGEGAKSKAWKDIWGCGQGIGAVKASCRRAELVARLRREYDAARARFAAGAARRVGSPGPAGDPQRAAFDSAARRAAPARTIVIEGERIVAVTQEPIQVDGARRIDAGGRVVLPGLIDAHVHVVARRTTWSGWRCSRRRWSPPRASRILREMLQRGFTTVRDAAGADFGLQEAVERGLFEGPRLFIAGFPISQTGGHADMRPKGVRDREMFCSCAGLGLVGAIADGVGEVRRAVREQVRNGANQIKIMAGGGISSPTDPIDGTQFSLEELRAAGEEAEAANLYAMAHAYSPRAVTRAVQAGVRSIEHGNLIDEATARVMKAHGAFLVPTLSTYAALADGARLGWSAAMLDKLRAGARHRGDAARARRRRAGRLRHRPARPHARPPVGRVRAARAGDVAGRGAAERDDQRGAADAPGRADRRARRRRLGRPAGRRRRPDARARDAGHPSRPAPR